jgi:predicted NAD/FAD-binding protein
MTANSGASSKPTVIIIGAGAAGIFTAYQINKLWPGQFNVQIFESGQVIGGNVSSVTVDYGGETYVIDAGAQFFYDKPQPLYVQLIGELGLSDQVASYPAGFTIWESSTQRRLIWVPSLVSGFASYSLEDWVRLIEFGVFLVAATALNKADQSDWTLSVDSWLADVPLSDDFKQNVIKNFLYQFVSLPLNRIGEASAVYATTYFVRNVFGTPASSATATSATAGIGDIPTFQTYQSLVGLEGILQQALTASGFSAQTSSPVTAVAPGPDGVAVTVNGNTINADHVVMACDPNTSARLLAAGGTASQDLINILQGMEYLELYIPLQQNGACWMPSDQSYWEPVTTVVNTRQQTVAFNAWFGPLRPPYDNNQLIPVFKSWGAPNLQSASCDYIFYSHDHNVLLPTTTFMQLRSQLVPYQGQNGLFFAGGWTNWFDSQEAALMSAIAIAEKLQPSGQTQQVSRASGAYDPSVTAGRVKSWLEMVLQQAPEPYKSKLDELVKQLG